ncbi:MAG: glycine zipper 2TM domain-containing protein [Gammaproteobacteria bacterium]|nr:glycine zipper 2TM domain-containing protein [Gammaproteobacteria bacterium]
MKRIMTVVIFGISALAFSGAAVSEHGFVGHAKVIEAEPLYETIEVAIPVTECWTERVARNNYRRGSYTAPLAGGIVGGVVGNQFGRGHGKTALTVVGALLGASIGNDHNTSHYRGRPRVEHVRRCETIDQYDQEQQLVGYRVKYRYEGQTYYTQTTEHPGKHIPVRVEVSPVNGI